MNTISKTVILSVMMWIVTGATFASDPKEVQIASPDGQLSVKVFTLNGRLSYSIQSGDLQVIRPSSLGLTVDSTDLGRDAKIVAAPAIRTIREDYPLLGSHRVAQNHAIEAAIPLETAGRKFSLIVRLYNDGVAIRYTLPEGTKTINGETTSWCLPENTVKIAWSGFSPCYEELSHVTPLDRIPEDKPVMAPLTIQTGDRYLSVSEADCENFSDMALIREGNVFRVTYPFALQGWKIERRPDNGPLVPDGSYHGQKVSPWRTTVVAKSLTGLVNSDLIMNCCPAPGNDFSWVKPGRCLWQWWSVGSPQYEDQKNWYDAAARLKWEYYLIDDGWRFWKQSGKDQWTLLKEVIDYGRSVGVKSIVWVDSKEFRQARERRAYLEKVKAAGADGIKIDFIPDATSGIMQWYMGTMQDCAELKLLLNFHGSVKPTGLRRTYPNDITREAVRGNEYHMTRYKRVEPLEQDVCLPFTRLMAGPADITPVMLNPVELTTTKFTWAHEFAQAIVYLSPVTHFCDQYTFYLESPLFDLFREIPTVWDETRVLPCTDMGEVVAYARRKGNTWWIGVMNGANEREVKIPLDFLKKPVKATLIYDSAVNTEIDRHEQTVSPRDVLTVRLIPGGGFVARMQI